MYSHLYSHLHCPLSLPLLLLRGLCRGVCLWAVGAGAVPPGPLARRGPAPAPPPFLRSLVWVPALFFFFSVVCRGPCVLGGGRPRGASALGRMRPGRGPPPLVGSLAGSVGFSFSLWLFAAVVLSGLAPTPLVGPRSSGPDPLGAKGRSSRGLRTPARLPRSFVVVLARSLRCVVRLVARPAPRRVRAAPPPARPRPFSAPRGRRAAACWRPRRALFPSVRGRRLRGRSPAWRPSVACVVSFAQPPPAPRVRCLLRCHVVCCGRLSWLLCPRARCRVGGQRCERWTTRHQPSFPRALRDWRPHFACGPWLLAPALCRVVCRVVCLVRCLLRAPRRPRSKGGLRRSSRLSFFLRGAALFPPRSLPRAPGLWAFRSLLALSPSAVSSGRFPAHPARRPGYVRWSARPAGRPPAPCLGRGARYGGVGPNFVSSGLFCPTPRRGAPCLALYCLFVLRLSRRHPHVPLWWRFLVGAFVVSFVFSVVFVLRLSRRPPRVPLWGRPSCRLFRAFKFQSLQRLCSVAALGVRVR